MQIQVRTLTGYALAVLVVLAILNGIAWFVGAPRPHGLRVFSAGFSLGMLGIYIAVHLYGYKRSSILSRITAFWKLLYTALPSFHAFTNV
jgi:hypothetical protein